MPAPESLMDVYTDEMKDLWSANDQMTRAVKTMAAASHDPKLKTELEHSISGIEKHSNALKSLLEEGMEGLVKEALKHTTKEAPEDGELLDLVIIAQYQRMSHYGITGFGSAAAYAGALGMEEHVGKLKEIVAEIYKADKYASRLGEKAAKVAPKKD